MPVTLKQIAELAGVSRGTVDRALYNRGRVNPEVAARIRAIADELGYQPNRAGRALALQKNPIKIGVIIQSVETPFMVQVLNGIRQATDELAKLGVQILKREIRGISADREIAAIDELIQEGIGGLALLPVQDDRLRSKINEVVAAGIPVVTFNSDISSTQRMCFVGLNNLLSGRACAGLMGAVMGQKGKVLMINGHSENDAHARRAEGFCSELALRFPEIRIVAQQFCYDDDAVAQKITEDTLREHPDLGGIFLIAHGQKGACDALHHLKRRDIHMIGYDLVPDNINGLLHGDVEFLIGQGAREQGYQPLMILFDYLFAGKEPKSPFQYTDIVIKTRYNI